MWTVQQTWTKFTFPFVFREVDIPIDTMAAAYLCASFPLGDGGEQVQVWEERHYSARELENLSPYIKRYMQMPLNQRRLSLHPRVLAALGVYHIDGLGPQSAGIQFAAIDLHLFFNGIGILVIEVHPEGGSVSHVPISWIEDSNAALASLSRGALMQHDLHWLVAGRPPLVRDDSTPCSFTSMISGHPFHLNDFISDVLLAPCRLDQMPNNTEPLWESMVDTFLPAFGAVLISLSDPTGRLEGQALAESFAKFAAEHLTVLRKSLPARNAHVLAHQMFGDPEHNYTPYHNVIHSQSLEGGFILAFDNGSPHFHLRPTPAMESFRTNYFLMALLALHQRLSILKYTMDAAEASLAADRMIILQTLRGHIYDFTSRCYFTQASISEERDQLYRRWQRAFHVPEMYDGLKAEVGEIEDYLAGIVREREREDRQLQIRNENTRTLLFTYISVMFIPITVVLNLITASPVWAPWLNFHTNPWRAGLLLAGSAVVLVVIAIEIARFWRRWQAQVGILSTAPARPPTKNAPESVHGDKPATVTPSGGASGTNRNARTFND